MKHFQTIAATTATLICSTQFAAAAETPDMMETAADLYLKPKTKMQTITVDLDDSVSTLDDKCTCKFNNAEWDNMFSSDHILSKDGSSVLDNSGNEIKLAVKKAQCQSDDGTPSAAELIMTVDEDQEIIEMTINGNEACESTYFKKDHRTDSPANSFWVWQASDMVDETDREAKYFADTDDAKERNYNLEGDNSRSHKLRGGNRKLQTCGHEANDGTSDECQCWTTLDIAILYDGAFCAMAGSASSATTKIQSIVADASAHLETNMCIKLKLTTIQNVDNDNECSANNNAFRNMNRNQLCSGNENWLGQFTEEMTSNGRKRYLEDRGVSTTDLASTHLFSGYQGSGAVGCAWIGSVCSERYAYGIDLMAWTSNTAAQAAVLTHELGHNLGARHVSSSANHMMKPVVSQNSMGFKEESVTAIMDTLGSKTCWSKEDKINQAPPVPYTNKPYNPNDRKKKRMSLKTGAWDDRL